MEDYFYWFIAGIVLLIFELFVPGLVMVFFGVGALIAGLAAWMFEMSWQVEILIFLVSSILSLIFMRKYLLEKMAKKDKSGEVEDIIGENAMVTETIYPNRGGKIKFHGVDWKADAEVEIEQGKLVEIIDKRSIVLIVKPID